MSSSMKDKGVVYWITGLSGAGKTTIANSLYSKLKKSRSNLVLLDGDTLRDILGNQTDFSAAGRFELAMTYARLCRMLTDQGIDVICATISMFAEVRQWGRDNIDNYRLVYVRASMDTLIRRDQKQLYSRSLSGDVKNVYGMDIPFTEPESPDLILNNEGDETPEELVARLLAEFEPEGNV